MLKELKYIPSNWRKVSGSRNFRNQFFITMLVFVLVCLHDFYYLRVFQTRPGFQVNDIILNHLPPLDFSLPIFIIEYSTLLTVFIFLLVYPDRLLKGFQMASIVLLARTMSIYLIALEPPKDMILLYDPIALFFLHHISDISRYILYRLRFFIRAIKSLRCYLWCSFLLC